MKLPKFKLSLLVKIFLAMVVLLIIFSAILDVITFGTKYSIVSATQFASTQKADIFQKIDIKLNKQITQSFFATCKTNISPQVATALSYQADTLSLLPQTSYAFDTTYQVTIQCQNILYQQTFLTQMSSEMSDQTIKALQTLQDYQVGQAQEKALTAQPWRAQIPLVQSDFVLVYDETQNQYFVRTTLPPNSKKTQTDVQTEVTAALQKINAPTNLPIIWR